MTVLGNSTLPSARRSMNDATGSTIQARSMEKRSRHGHSPANSPLLSLRARPRPEQRPPEQRRMGQMKNASSMRLGPMLNKVPEVTLAFWVIKVMSTTVGETGADYLAVHVGLGTALTDAIMAVLLLVALVFQLRAQRYVPWRYWLTVVLVSIVGTQITDALTDGFEVSLYLSTAVFALALAVTFAVWYATEGTLSIRTINTTPRELFYWAAILFTFALGTAAGDLATEELGLGFR